MCCYSLYLCLLGMHFSFQLAWRQFIFFLFRKSANGTVLHLWLFNHLLVCLSLAFFSVSINWLHSPAIKSWNCTWTRNAFITRREKVIEKHSYFSFYLSIHFCLFTYLVMYTMRLPINLFIHLLTIFATLTPSSHVYHFGIFFTFHFTLLLFFFLWNAYFYILKSVAKHFPHIASFPFRLSNLFSFLFLWLFSSTT